MKGPNFDLVLKGDINSALSITNQITKISDSELTEVINKLIWSSHKLTNVVGKLVSSKFTCVQGD